MNSKTDIIVVGTGVAGLFNVLNLPRNKRILMITKAGVDASDSFLAQGGICVLRDENDYDSFFEDTMKAGHYENDKASVDVMIRTSPEIIQNLISFGVDFEKKNGQFVYTREGAHSKARILYHQDLTGKEITSKLLAEVKKRNNIRILEYTTMVDLICENNICSGVVISNEDNEISLLKSDYVVLATGGLGGLFDNSTNLQHLTGDAIAIAMKHHIELENISYIQIHPTTLYSKKKGRRFLISESVRGEGAVLYNQNMERFVDELLPRDVLTKAINEQMEKDGSKYVWLCMKEMGAEVIRKRFPNIYHRCLDEGYDVTRECIPVTPAQHYFMGGIKVNLDSKTTMEHLYAIGEISCNRVHGANRLASNSLLESLVFAKRAATHIVKNYESLGFRKSLVDLNDFRDLEQLRLDYKKIILDEIERSSAIE
ncbi:MAG: L-aspartate oxidase [Eubacteriaceae bacterium]|nr:L-aspartate oxidase [Eubacteriaceae bacterium]